MAADPADVKSRYKELVKIHHPMPTAARGRRRKAQGNQCSLFHPAGIGALARGVISPVQGSHGNWSLAVHKSACDYALSARNLAGFVL
jgi:hypothetical protein